MKFFPYLFLLFTLHAEEDIRDVHGLVTVKFIWNGWIWITVGTAILALFFIVWFFWKKRKELPPPRKAHEIALASLQHAQQRMKEGSAREFSFEVSQAVRIYIQSRFGLPASQKTTEEFLNQLLEEVVSKKDPKEIDSTQTSTALSTEVFLSNHTDRMREFLQYCDLAKFARWNLALAQMQGMLDSAIQFINETREREELPSKVNSKSS